MFYLNLFVDEPDTDLETDRLLGQQRTDDQGFFDEKVVSKNGSFVVWKYICSLLVDLKNNCRLRKFKKIQFSEKENDKIYNLIKINN